MFVSKQNYVNPAGAGLVEGVWNDLRLAAMHICLCAAIGHRCRQADQNQIQISRRVLMRSARIKPVATHHSCIRELAQNGPIDYHPFYHPLRVNRIKHTGRYFRSLKQFGDG